MIAQSNNAFIRWDWIWSHLDLIWEKVAEHLILTGIALGVGLVLSLFLSALALRSARPTPPSRG